MSAIPAGHLFERIGVKELRPKRRGIDRSKPKIMLPKGVADCVPCQENLVQEQLKSEALKMAASVKNLRTAAARGHAADLTPLSPQPPTQGLWAVGLTTVPERRSDGTLLRTLASLRAGGFASPILFVDGHNDGRWLSFNDDVKVFRGKRIGAVGNWLLAAWELLVRNPQAERFAIFQDDLVCCQNLKGYLDSTPWPDRSWLNLYTQRENEDVIVGKKGWVETPTISVSPHGDNWQAGRGAVALCFKRDALEACVTSSHWTRKIVDQNENNPSVGDHRQRRLMRVDGGVSSAMNLAGYREHVHAPSLVQHVGVSSSMGNLVPAQARSFLGENFDALDFLKGK